MYPMIKIRAVQNEFTLCTAPLTRQKIRETSSQALLLPIPSQSQDRRKPLILIRGVTALTPAHLPSGTTGRSFCSILPASRRIRRSARSWHFECTPTSHVRGYGCRWSGGAEAGCPASTHEGNRAQTCYIIYLEDTSHTAYSMSQASYHLDCTSKNNVRASLIAQVRSYSCLV